MRTGWWLAVVCITHHYCESSLSRWPTTCPVRFRKIDHPLLTPVFWFPIRLRPQMKSMQLCATQSKPDGAGRTATFTGPPSLDTLSAQRDTCIPRALAPLCHDTSHEPEKRGEPTLWAKIATREITSDQYRASSPEAGLENSGQNYKTLDVWPPILDFALFSFSSCRR